MLKIKVTSPDGLQIEATTDQAHLRFRCGRKPTAKPLVPVVVERTAVLVVPVPVRETIFVAPPPAPTADEIAYAILRELDDLERPRRDLQQPEKENGQPRRSWANLSAALRPAVT